MISRFFNWISRLWRKQTSAVMRAQFTRHQLDATYRWVRRSSRFIFLYDTAGCFCCGSLFKPSDIERCTDDDHALCPYCGMDAVMPIRNENDGPRDAEMLLALRHYWFGSIQVWSDDVVVEQFAGPLAPQQHRLIRQPSASDKYTDMFRTRNRVTPQSAADEADVLALIPDARSYERMIYTGAIRSSVGTERVFCSELVVPDSFGEGSVGGGDEDRVRGPSGEDTYLSFFQYCGHTPVYLGKPELYWIGRYPGPYRLSGIQHRQIPDELWKLAQQYCERLQQEQAVVVPKTVGLETSVVSDPAGTAA